MHKRDSYEDIIQFPHHVSHKRKPMTQYQRAAQFSPFAALTGHHEAICETARLTEEKIQLDEDTKEILNKKLVLILENKKQRVPVKVTYFVQDLYKKGGSYQVYEGYLKEIDDINHEIIFEDKTKIKINNILDIQSTLFLNITWI